MKVYILPCHTQFQPSKSRFRYPAHNKDWGVEQDFFTYLKKHPRLLTNNPCEADWHYLPVYWTRWHLLHKYGKTGRPELQAEVNRLIEHDTKTFTICQYDDGPLVDLGNATIFLSSRQTEKGLDIPLISSSHRRPFFPPSKNYLASFLGRVSTHPIREQMVTQVQTREDVYLYDGHKSPRAYVKDMLASYLALCPRGYGGSSFRFFEAMQLGVVPFLIGEPDTRPFKTFIDWGEVSIFSQSADNINSVLDALDREELLLMGQQAGKLYQEKLTYQKWCSYVIQELRQVT